MSTKSPDQAGRTGAYFHLICRSAAGEDSGLAHVRELNSKCQHLPLTEDGLFGSILQNSKHQISNISWWLVNGIQSKIRLIQDQQKCINLLVSLGFIINKEKSSLVPCQNVTYFSFRQGDSTTNFRESTKSSAIDSEKASRSDSSIRFSENIGYDGFSDRSFTKCPITYETSKITLRFWSQFSKDMTIQVFFTQHFMVDKYSQHAKRPILSVTQNNCYGLDRCFEKRVWVIYSF